MRSFLYVALFVVCCMTSCLSSPAGIAPREDYTELRAIFNISGFLTLQTPKNFTLSSPMSIRMSGPVDLLISPIETFDLRKQIVDGDDQVVSETNSVFRKDYSLDVEKRGWFKLHRIPAKWEDARIRCELEGAELASPLDSQIHEEMLSMLQNTRLFSIFTGVHSLFSYGDYYSLKGVSVEEMPLRWSIALSYNKTKRCVALVRDSTIDNVDCDHALPYICYKYNDYTPLSECGTIDTEYKLNPQSNTCYKLHRDKKTWEDAFKTCSAEGGALTVINSVAEFAAVIQLVINDTVAELDLDYHVFVGIMYWEHSGQWITIHDTILEKSGFSTWSPNGQINRQAPLYNNYCGALRQLGLAKVPCNTEAPFVCEKKP